VVGHYRGKVFAWDVVNEAFDEGKNAGKQRSTIWYDHPGIGLASHGPAFIAQCFRWAHEADPNALLFYNEAEADELNPKSDAIYAMVQRFLRDGVPINGIGLQMHISNLHPNIASISSNIARFTALGLQVHITEMDVSLPVDAAGNASRADLQSQAEIYRQIASACLSHRAPGPPTRPILARWGGGPGLPDRAVFAGWGGGCTAIQTWGFTDKYSWIGSHSKHTQGAALLFDSDYHPKPAYEALLQSLSAAR
jgi:endo-1,4-beta-xylanase